MNNIKAIINKHNKRILHQNHNNNNNQRCCNCQVKNNCPMKGKCLEKCIIYQATVTTTSTNTQESYIGLTATEFKTRYNNHVHSFKHCTNRNATELSKHVWKLKDRKLDYTIDWKIITKAAANYNSKNICDLCAKEKLYIIYSHIETEILSSLYPLQV